MNERKPTVRLTKPAEFPEQYAETCRQALRQVWERVNWRMREEFGFYDLPLLTDEDLVQTMLADQLSLVARAAVGKLDRDNEMLVGEVMETIQSICESLFASPFAYSYHIPAEFWQSPLGVMIARAQLWLRGDELISLSEAAQIAGVTVQAVSQAVDDGRLFGYYDPDEPNPQRRRRVSRRQVEEWQSTRE